MPAADQKPSLLADSVLIGLLRLFLPGLLVLLGGLLLYYSIAFERTMEGLKLQQREQVEQSKRTLLKELQTAISDLVILSELEAIRELNGAETERALHHLTQHFTALAKHRKRYDQIRYLDSRGMEVIRINFNQGDPQPVPQEQLQNKGQRYYFHDSFILKRQQLFISPLDLNIEQGEIEEPYKPVIRLGMPLFNRAGEKVGVVLLNYLAQQLHTYTAFLRDISEHKAHEESIRSAKRQLEMRVNQRTQELLKINQNLQEQIVERVRTEERLKIAQGELEASNRKLAEHAAKDSLTQIANRRTFDTRLNEEWRRCQRSGDPLALILFDIDFFKRFNDNYGHLAGDECLRRIGELLQQGHYAQRASDLVARYGGEEFVVILSATTLSSALNIGEQIRHDIERLQIAHEFRGDDLPPVVTVSLGAAALHPQSRSNPENLIAAADEALYRAKLLGRNRLISSEEALTLQAER